MSPQISIVTPSFRQLGWLQLCASSIADQAKINLEHIVQDTGSGPEFESWAKHWSQTVNNGAPDDEAAKSFQFVSEKDEGMYDAVNRGLRRTSAEIVAYLNCDEQYLPGALQEVLDYFAKHPEVDVAFGHAIVVDAEGKFLAHRKAILPTEAHTLVSMNLAILTCATFIRRHVFDKLGLFFDPRKKDIGDGEWVLRLLRSKVRLGILPYFISTFTETGDNRNLKPTALREKAEFLASAPAWARWMRHGVIAHYRVRKYVAGAYRQAPFDYAIYTLAHPGQRTVFHVSNPSFRWMR